MTTQEIINRNIGLTFDFIRQAVKEPALLDKIPDGSVLEFIEKDFVKREMSNSDDIKTKTYLRVQTKLEVI